MLKLIIFTVIFILLVRFISRLFLPAPGKQQGNFHIFYQAFKGMRNQQKQQNEQQKQTESGDVKNRLDDIEEADYEDVTDDKSD